MSDKDYASRDDALSYAQTDEIEIEVKGRHVSFVREMLRQRSEFYRRQVVGLKHADADPKAIAEARHRASIADEAAVGLEPHQTIPAGTAILRGSATDLADLFRYGPDKDEIYESREALAVAWIRERLWRARPELFEKQQLDEPEQVDTDLDAGQPATQPPQSTAADYHVLAGVVVMLRQAAAARAAAGTEAMLTGMADGLDDVMYRRRRDAKANA